MIHVYRGGMISVHIDLQHKGTHQGNVLLGLEVQAHIFFQILYSMSHSYIIPFLLSRGPTDGTDWMRGSAHLWSNPLCIATLKFNPDWSGNTPVGLNIRKVAPLKLRTHELIFIFIQGYFIETQLTIRSFHSTPCCS